MATPPESPIAPTVGRLGELKPVAGAPYSHQSQAGDAGLGESGSQLPDQQADGAAASEDVPPQLMERRGDTFEALRHCRAGGGAGRDR